MPKLKAIISKKWFLPVALLVAGLFSGYMLSNARASRMAELAQASFLVQIAQKDLANAQLEAKNEQILAQVQTLSAENAQLEADRAGLQDSSWQTCRRRSRRIPN